VSFILTRIHVGDYGRWKPQFDQDRPRAREAARERLVVSGVLDRFEDMTRPTILEVAETVTR